MRPASAGARSLSLGLVAAILVLASLDGFAQDPAAKTPKEKSSPQVQAPGGDPANPTDASDALTAASMPCSPAMRCTTG